MTLAALAEQAGVSEPTVVRFCRSLGIDGYADFKLELARARAAGGAAYLHREISFGDGLPTVCAKVFQSSINALAVVQQSLDPTVVSRAIDLLAAAPRIDCMRRRAVGDRRDRCAAEADAARGALRGASRRASADALGGDAQGRATWRCCSPTTGGSRTCCGAPASRARPGAATIAVTRSGTPLAAAVDVAIAVDVPEDTFVYAPMTTRLAQLAVLDVLATGVALRRGPRIAAHLEQIKETMSDQWLVAEDPRADAQASHAPHQGGRNHDDPAFRPRCSARPCSRSRRAPMPRTSPRSS